MRLFMNLNKIFGNLEKKKYTHINNTTFIFSGLYKKFFKLFQSFQNNIINLEQKFKQECSEQFLDLEQ